MTSEQLAALAGAVLSLAISYIPGLKDWYDALTPTPKRFTMLVLLALSAVGALVWGCRLDLAPCVALGWENYLSAFIAAAIANQTAYLLSPISPERRVTRKAAFERHMGPAVQNRTNEPLP